MVDNGPGNPPPDPNDPLLRALTFEQVAQLVNEINPEVFYQRAAAFDQSGGRLQDVLDRVRHEMNLVREAWTGKAAEEFDGLVREVTTRTTGVVQFLQNPGYGAVLRDAGDRLADHQRRFRDLQAQKAVAEAAAPVPGAPTPAATAQVATEAAKQILLSLRMAYWDVGNALSPLPYRAPDVVVDTSVVDTNTVTDNDITTTTGDTGNGGEEHGRVGTNHLTSTAFVTPTHDTTTNSHSFGGAPFMVAGHTGQDAETGGPVRRGTVTPAYDPNSPLFQSDQAGGYVPGVVGMPGAVFAAGQDTQDRSSVLGHSAFVSQREDSFVAGAAAVPAVLGRPIDKPIHKPVRSTTSNRGQDDVDSEIQDFRSTSTERRPIGDLLFPELVDRPETVSKGALPGQEVDQLAEPRLIVTTTDSPATEQRTSEIAAEFVAAVPQQHAVATTGSLTTAEVPAQVPQETRTVAKPVLNLGATGKTFAMTASSGGSGGGVTHAFNPESRGMFAPGAAGPDGLAAEIPVETVTTPATTTQQARGGPVDPMTGQMGGYPMSPMMMGGMGGFGPQQNGRMAAMPTDPRPDIWDPATGSPNVVGRRAQQQDEEEQEGGETKLSKEEIKARLAEKFAELDRLTQRRK